MNQQVIQAQVSARFIHKADRHFSNNLSDIFIELLQNARRTGATLIAVETNDGSGGGRFHRNATPESGDKRLGHQHCVTA